MMESIRESEHEKSVSGCCWSSRLWGARSNSFSNTHHRQGHINLQDILHATPLRLPFHLLSLPPPLNNYITDSSNEMFCIFRWAGGQISAEIYSKSSLNTSKMNIFACSLRHRAKELSTLFFLLRNICHRSRLGNSS